MSIRKPQNDSQLRRLCERYSELDGKIGAIEESRDVAIAKANAVVDADLEPLLKQRASIEEKIEPYFMENRAQLLPGKRKSVELGGCELGARKGKTTLQIVGNENDVRDVLSGIRWAKPFLKIRTSLDRAALLRGLDGSRGSALVELGVSRKEGEDSFFIKRTEQSGTQAKA